MKIVQHIKSRTTGIRLLSQERFNVEMITMRKMMNFRLILKGIHLMELLLWPAIEHHCMGVFKLP